MPAPTEDALTAPADNSPAPATPPPRAVGRLRGTIPRWQVLCLSGLCVALVLGVWWAVTYGEISEERLVSRVRLPSPAETFGEVASLFKERKADINTLVSLKRVVIGFTLAALVGIPLGVLCGCFPYVSAFLAPVTVFGRNVPMAALIPLTFALFGGSEGQKIMFIFLAAVAFIISDSSQAIRDVASRYIDTAFTLGASRMQTVLKVLVPLAMPSVFNALRLLFGLAFGYIMLVEVVQDDAKVGGIGAIINTSQRRGPTEHIYLILMIIPLVAPAIDRLLYWVQQQLFPYRYGGAGLLARLWKALGNRWKSLVESLFPAAAEAEYRAVLAELKAKSAAEQQVGAHADSAQQ